jgi:hypothetical protein
MHFLDKVREQFIEFHHSAIETTDAHGDMEVPSFELREAPAQNRVDHFQEWHPRPRKSSNSVDIFAPSLLSVKPRLPGEASKDLEHPSQVVERWISGILHHCLYADRVWVADPAEILAWQILTADDPHTIIRDF